MVCSELVHETVLLEEAVYALSVGSQDFVVDCTFGRGGHSAAILERLGPQGRLLALDRDYEAFGSAQAKRLAQDERFEIAHVPFSELGNQVKSRGVDGEVASILFDLGVSSPQLDDPDRGFSFMRDGPLDMRMNKLAGQTAADWVNTAAEGELARVFRIYGEERFSKRIARAISDYRKSCEFKSTGELSKVIDLAIPFREKGKHPATRCFQAIRIFLNRELEELEEALDQAVSLLRPGGRLAVISFHSLEDRIVKRFIRSEERGEGGSAESFIYGGSSRNSGRLIKVGKAIFPSAHEVERNPRARSAVLRVAERVKS